jgi:hypothetical protein
MYCEKCMSVLFYYRFIPYQITKCTVAAEFFVSNETWLVCRLFIAKVKLQYTVLSNPTILRIQNTETCGMQIVLHLVEVSTYSEKYLSL